MKKIVCSLLILCSTWLMADERLNPKQQWWDEAWWNDGQLAVPVTHPVIERSVSYNNGDVEVPALILRPDDDKRYPAVLFQHGRRGLLSLPDISSDKICLYSHTRGGYMTLKVAVTMQRQNKEVACYVSFYPHMQDPNAPEPMQVYRYAPEADRLEIPTLIFIGDQEQYQRRRSIETAVKSMREKNLPVQLFIYPGVGRGFDFRLPNVRTLADDLAAKDAIQRSAGFINRHLNKPES